MDPAALDRRLAAAAIAVAVLAPRTLIDQRVILCPIRRSTGLSCPTCGLTRSVHAASRLQIRQSVADHPLGIPALGAAILVATGRWRPSTEQRPTPAVLAAAAAWLATWLVRLTRAARVRRARPTVPPTPVG